MAGGGRAVVVMGKRPVPGRVKTRLGLPETVAAQLYRAFLRDVFMCVENALTGRPARRLFACALEPGEGIGHVANLVPPGWGVVRQVGSDLGARMRHAWRMGEAQHVVVLGSDLPTLPSERISEALDHLEEASLSERSDRVVVVPATDGGYVLIGMSQDHAALFQGIPWSTDKVMAATEEAAERAGLSLHRLAPHPDVDRFEDLERLVLDVRPESWTAAALRDLGLAP